jgi:hypothetical protein
MPLHLFCLNVCCSFQTKRSKAQSSKNHLKPLSLSLLFLTKSGLPLFQPRILPLSFPPCGPVGPLPAHLLSSPLTHREAGPTRQGHPTSHRPLPLAPFLHHGRLRRCLPSLPRSSPSLHRARFQCVVAHSCRPPFPKLPLYRALMSPPAEAYPHRLSRPSPSLSAL